MPILGAIAFIILFIYFGPEACSKLTGYKEKYEKLLIEYNKLKSEYEKLKREYSRIQDGFRRMNR